MIIIKERKIYNLNQALFYSKNEEYNLKIEQDNN
jgi:hypothetical protein